MINLTKEKNLALSAKDRYDILNFAIEAAEDGGFLNSFIFERAIYCYAAILLDEENADAIRKNLSEDLIDTWDMLVKEDVIQEMNEKYAEDLEILADEGWHWFKEYNSYITSARGVLSAVEQFSGDIIGQAADRLKETMQESGAEKVIDIAEEWGMNRKPEIPAESKPYEEKDIEGLFV